MATEKSGYTIIFGGYKNIKWEKNEPKKEKATSTSPINPNFGNASNPYLAIADLAIRAIEAVAALGQWYEMRQQNKLNYAQFEERRISWLYEMLNHTQNELTQGQFNIDTVIYLKREIKRFLDKVLENELVDIPSILLLNLDRVLNTVKELNTFCYNLYLTEIHKGVNFLIPNNENANPVDWIKYKPYYELLEQEKISDYLNNLKKAIASVPADILKYSTVFIAGGIPGILLYDLLNSLFSKKEKKKVDNDRLNDFQVMKYLIVEIESSTAILNSLNSMKERKELNF